VKNCPGGLHRARIFLARIVAQVSQFGEGILLNVGWVEVVGGLGDAAELNEGLRGVKVTEHVEAAWLKKWWYFHIFKHLPISENNIPLR
jgi:hypothetical protein